MDRKAQINSVIKQASPQEIQEGFVWYSEARQWCEQVSKETGIELKKVIAVLAALSPRKRWDLNKKITKEYLEGKRDVHTKTQVTKCDLIMQGKDIPLVLGGLKTINFFSNILEPTNPDYCTIDVWMLRIFNERPKLTPKQYNSLKQVCIEYSKEIGWITPNTQAVAWISKRNKHD